MESIATIILVVAFILDLIFGDPRWLPHLIVLFGKLIAIGERLLNKGKLRLFKGAFLTIILVSSTYLSSWMLLKILENWQVSIFMVVAIILMFYCLANKTLMDEGQAVFNHLKESLEKGRHRLSWIVGRDTTNLNEQQIKKATFETLSENLSDGVIAPLFYFVILGVPGAVAYKMINTLDSMIGYKNDRYLYFGRFAARLDDVANFIPARLTAILMLLISGKFKGLVFVWKEGEKHSSPNAGYPEAALAYIISCRLGGPNYYHGKLVDKPYIGSDERIIEDHEIKNVTLLNLKVSVLFVCIILLYHYFAKI